VFSLNEEAELFFSLDDARKLHPRELGGEVGLLTDRAVLGDGPDSAQPVASRLAHAGTQLPPERTHDR
jgi:hypothetical protein